MEKLENYEDSKKKEIQEIDSARTEAQEFNLNLGIQMSDYVESIESIINSNENLRKAINDYSGGDVKEPLAHFNATVWGGSALEERSLNNISEIVRANKNKYPDPGVMSDIKNELSSRMESIKNELNSFSGDEKEAFNLIQTLHKEKILEPLNGRDNPLMKKIPDHLFDWYNIDK